MNVRHDHVSVFVVRADDSGESHEFLQLRRSAGDYMGATWQIVRGGVEAGESYADAALRELHEESGLTPLEMYRLGSVESFYTSSDDTLWHSVAFCVIVDRAQHPRLNHEHEDYRWVRREEMESRTIWASERRVLADLCRDILDDGIAKPHLRLSLPS